MALEIERKFLINEDVWNELKKPNGLICKQIYLSKEIDKTIRIRILGEKGFVTIKSAQQGFTRNEYEYEIPVQDAIEMIDQFGENPIEKTRYLIPFKNHIWEVDVFEGKNKGLLVAEIELRSEEESFEKPNWIAQEVTGNHNYSNSILATHPYCDW